MCIAEFAPQGDLNTDCAVNPGDLAIVGRDWRNTDMTIHGAAPDDSRLLLWYKFDETEDSNGLGDSSGNGYAGRIVKATGPATWDPEGHDAGCLKFHDDTAIMVPTDVLADIDKEITLMVWLKGGRATGRHNVIFETGDNDFVLRADVPNMDEAVYWQAGIDANDRLQWDGSSSPDWRDYWNHYAFVKNANTGLMRIYCNGLPIAERNDSFNSLAQIRNTLFDVGALIKHVNDYIGRMDDFKIYGYALSPAEIVGAASGGGDLYVPLKSPGDLHQDNKIDFKDYAIIMKNWLREELCP